MIGILLAIAATAMLVAAGLACSSRILPEATRSERWLAGLFVAFVLLTSSTILLSWMGWIGRPGFLAAATLLFVGTIPLSWRRLNLNSQNEGGRLRRWLKRFSGSGGSTLKTSPLVGEVSCGRLPSRNENLQFALVGLTIPIVGLVLISWLWRGVASPVLVVSDGPIYHLPFAVRWIQDGSLSRTWTPFGELAATYFPGNGEIWMCWLLALVGDDRLAKIAQWFFLIPTAIALYTLGVRCGDRWSAIWPSLCWSACLLVFVSSVKSDVDLPMTFLIVAGLSFIDRSWQISDASERRRSLILAAMAFGAAAGTKSIGLLYSAAPMMVLFVLLRRDWKGCLAALAAAFVAGGYWYLRNLWKTGNPLYPFRLAVGDHVLFDGWYDAETMRRTSSYHTPVFEFRAAWEFLSVIAQPTLWVALGLSMTIGFIALGFRSDARRSIALCVGMAMLWAAEYWFVQPYNTQQRFLLPAMAVAFVPIAFLRGLWGLVPIALIVFALFGELRQFNPFDWRMLTAGAMLAAASIFSIRFERLFSPLLTGSSIVAILLAPTIFSPRALTPSPLFYSTNDFGSRLFPAWARLEASIKRNSPQGGVVGYAGTNLPYYLAGPELKNRVRYVNVEGEASWLQHDHFRELRRTGSSPENETAFAQWHRDQPDKETWLKNLDALGVDHFFVARENFHGRPDAPQGLAPFPIEYEWLTSMPDRFERLGPPRSSDGEEPWGIAFRVRRPDGRPN
jgi:hypothetical protein